MDLKAGLADQSVNFAAYTTATGAAVTVTSATAGLALWYRRGVAGAKTAISPSDLATLETAHADGGILVIAGAEHRLDLPDAACTAGVLTVSWGGTATGITIDGGTANLIGQANTASDVSHISGDSDAADNAELMFDGTGYAGGTAKLEVDVAKWLGTAVQAAVNGYPKVDLTYILGTLLSETGAGYLAAAFKKLFDVAIPLLVASDAMRGTDGANTTAPDNVSIAAILEDTGTTLPNSLALLATAAKLLKYVQLLARKDPAISTDNAAELAAVNADGGSGAGTYSNQTDAQEAIRDTDPLGTAMRGTDGANTVVPDNASIAAAASSAATAASQATTAASQATTAATQSTTAATQSTNAAADAATIKAVTAKLDTAMVQDGAVYDFTAAALAAAPASGAAVTVEIEDVDMSMEQS